MKRSMFERLLEAAHKRGATRIRFEVDLPRFFSDNRAGSWLAASGEGAYHRGPSGLEALCRLVGSLEDP